MCYIVFSRRFVNMNFKVYVRKRTWPILSCLISIYLEELVITIKLSQVVLSPSQESIPKLPAYESGMLTTLVWQQCGREMKIYGFHLKCMPYLHFKTFQILSHVFNLNYFLLYIIHSDFFRKCITLHQFRSFSFSKRLIKYVALKVSVLWSFINSCFLFTGLCVSYLYHLVVSLYDGI